MKDKRTPTQEEIIYSEYAFNGLVWSSAGSASNTLKRKLEQEHIESNN